MPARRSFSYALVRVVPRVDREEFVNAGAIVFCDADDFLAAALHLDEERLRAFAPDADVPLIQRHLAAIERVCAGAGEAGSIGAMPRRDRWRWLVAPRSTIIQTSAPHAGMCLSPAEELERLLARYVVPRRR